MSGIPGYTPYTPPGSQPSPNYNSFATWGQGMGGPQNGAAPMSMEDLYYQAGADNFRAQPGLKQQELDIARQAAAPPSKWATGAQTFGSVAQGLAGLGSMYLGYQNMKMQKEAFKFNKGVTNTNLNNSIMDYNRRLGDTLANRALNNGQGNSWAAGELAKYSAKRSS